VRLALAGDTMLGRVVADTLQSAVAESLVTPELAELMRSADLTILNLECCISERGAPIAIPGKPFFFRAPPKAIDLLTYLGVDCVTLANNHALDYGEVALLDTFDHLRAAGIPWVGAGSDWASAIAPIELAAGADRVKVVAFADHPHSYAARTDRPGIAFVDLTTGVDDWVIDEVSTRDMPVLVAPHWGPNMVGEPTQSVRNAAARLVAAGAAVVAGHSAHVVHGVAAPVLYDLGDFLDDYWVDPELRNDLGLLFLADVDRGRLRRVEAVPLELQHCRTVVARGEAAAFIRRRFREACRRLGEESSEQDGRVVLEWPAPASRPAPPRSSRSGGDE
jgi:poly-gamma-glutamate capsule biosynthesis protein CapA/YwtB (metallophosphatase superfamily)